MEQPTVLATIVIQLGQYKGRWPQVAAESGVPISTVRKVAQGRTKNPGIDTIEKLWTFLKQQRPQ